MKKIPQAFVKRSFKLAIQAALLVSLPNLYGSVADIAPYQDAQLVKSSVAEDSFVEVPLGKIRRAGRGWEPEKVVRVKAEAYQSLYKIHRNAVLEEVERYYRQAILSPDKTILFECHSRDCGSSNAWANDFFKEYLLYGGDQNQTLLVVQQASVYQLMYLTRRGAGDIMVRLDEIKVAAAQQLGVDLVAQMDAQDIPRIRRFLSELSAEQTVVAYVSARQEGGVSAVARADQYIAAITLALGPRLSAKVRFLNVANVAREELAEGRISFVYEPLR